jgi:cytochrome b subunit of formate dehydrogenase
MRTGYVSRSWARRHHSQWLAKDRPTTATTATTEADKV